MTDSTPNVAQWIGQVPPSDSNSFENTVAPPVGGAPGFELPYLSNQPTAIPIQGTGGYVSPAAQFVSGMQAGQSMMDNLVTGSRRAQLYKQDQLAAQSRMISALNQDRAARGLTPLPNIGDPGYSSAELQPYTGGPSLMSRGASALASGVRSLVSNFQRGGPVQGNGVEPSMPARPGISGYAAGGPVGSPVTPAVPPPGAAMPDVNGVGPVTPPAATPGAPPTFPELVNLYALNLQRSTLSGNGQPSHVANAASPVAPAEGVSSGSAQPHSLTPDWFDATDHDARTAAAMAAQAGQDPAGVYSNLIAMRNSVYQGEVLKHLSGAFTALQSGDQQGVERALRNVYYYLPDGKDLQLRRGANGAIEYQDPINPVDANGNPRYVPVTAQHLQLLGQAALHPETVANTMMQYRMLPFNMKMMQMVSRRS